MKGRLENFQLELDGFNRIQLDLLQVGELFPKASDLDEACLGCRPLHVATQARGDTAGGVTCFPFA